MPIFKIHILGPNLCDFKIYPLIRPIPLTIEKEMSLEVADSAENQMLFLLNAYVALAPLLGMWHSVTLESLHCFQHRTQMTFEPQGDRLA